MNRDIADILKRRGEELFDAKATDIKFTKEPTADALLNDLNEHPHAFVLACIMDRQMKAERAWLIPHLVCNKLGGFSFARLRSLTLSEITDLLTKPQKLHRFPAEMSRNFHSAVQHIANEYGGDASRIWRGTPPSAEVVARFLRFRGAGPKIATMAANILARDFKVPMADYYSIDVSVDVHVRRVFTRLGLVNKAAAPEEIIYCARALHPPFPGLLDFPAWEIGRKWCLHTTPRCEDCYMKDVCPVGSAAASPLGESVGANQLQI